MHTRAHVRLDVARGVIVYKADPTKKIPIASVISFAGNPIVGKGAHIHETTWQRMAWAAGVAEVEVDTATGSIKVLNYVAAHDVGRAINPTLIEGQVEGGAAQGLGMALMEEFTPGKGENLHDYLIPTVGDMPPVETILIEKRSSVGPFGAKGIGEQAVIPTAPAILNAIHDAIGVRIRKVPATPDRIRAAILAARGPGDPRG